MNTKFLSILLILGVPAMALAEEQENFLNLASQPAKIDGALSGSFDKPYREFVNDWMKDSKLAGLNRILKADWGQFEANRQFFAKDQATYRNIVQNAAGTFKAYCEHHQGEIIQLRSDMFCMKDKPIAWMAWRYDATNRYTHFRLDDGRRAEAYYQAKVTDIQPGNSINTSFGPALVVERGQNGMIKIQPQQGTERWITTDNVRAEFY